MRIPPSESLGEVMTFDTASCAPIDCPSMVPLTEAELELPPPQAPNTSSNATARIRSAWLPPSRKVSYATPARRCNRHGVIERVRRSLPSTRWLRQLQAPAEVPE